MSRVDANGDIHDAAGRYAGRTHGIPAESLTYEQRGTFLYPPLEYAGANDYIEFWSNVPISDGVLSNIRAGYAEAVRKDLDHALFVWAREYDAKHSRALQSPLDKKREKALEERQAAGDAYRVEYMKGAPERLHPTQTRTIARVGQMINNIQILNQDDADAVRSHRVQLGPGWTPTVEEVDELFQLGRIYEYFEDPDVTASERLEDVRLEIRGMRAEALSAQE